MYRPYNPNPLKKKTGDCTVRAISKVLDQDWHETYLPLAIYGYLFCDMPNSDDLWGKYLKSMGFKRYIIPDDGIGDYTVEDFCRDHPDGRYLLCLQNHVIAVVDGDWFDTWDCGDESPIYYWIREEELCTEMDTE